jgi:hypothetical protein
MKAYQHGYIHLRKFSGNLEVLDAEPFHCAGNIILDVLGLRSEGPRWLVAYGLRLEHFARAKSPIWLKAHQTLD